MKKILLVFAILTACGAAHAACPSGWEEVTLENFSMSNTTCPAGTESYYHVDSLCNANVL